MTNVRWFGVYKHSTSNRQFTCGIGISTPNVINDDLETPLLYRIKVKMKDGSVPPNSIPAPPSF